MLRLGFFHHKCGSTYLRKVLETLATLANVPVLALPDQFIIGKEHHAELSQAFTYFPNAHYERQVLQGNLGKHRAFNVIRDPRDIIVSGYFSHRYSHESEGAMHDWVGPLREKLNRLSFDEGLAAEIEHGHSLKQLSTWQFDNPNILELRAEDIVFATEEQCFKQLKRILQHLHFDRFEDKLLWHVMVELHEFFSGRRSKDVEDKTSHYRKGQPGDWKNYFKPQHVTLFKRHWGDLAVRLGYEGNNDWTNVPPERNQPAEEQVSIYKEGQGHA